ncbi:transposase [Salmonella enterica]|nr:transposase [Salmonella enterica]
MLKLSLGRQRKSDGRTHSKGTAGSSEKIAEACPGNRPQTADPHPGWHRIETFTRYKAKAEGKVCFRVPAPYTSQECAACGYTHPDNRRTQDAIVCLSCGYSDNADRNATRIIKKRAIDAILHLGTGLTNDNELVTGRGEQRKTPRPQWSTKRQKRKRER